MKTQRIVFRGPRDVRIEDAEVQDGPLAPHEVLLRTASSVISPGTELAHYAGGQTLFENANPYPFYPGYAAVGEVLAAGEEAPVRAGDLVLAHTPHQSITRFDSRSRVCVRVPDGVAPEQATFARLAQVSAVSFRLMQARPGDRAAVTGLGPVGNLAAQLARCAGLQVLGVDLLAERRDLAERCGITATLDPALIEGQQAVPAHQDRYNVVLECSGHDQALITTLTLAAPHGEIFLIGAAWRRGTDIVAADVARPVFSKYLALRSGWEWQIPLYGERPPGSVAGCTRWVLDCIGNGTLHVDELITDRVRPADVSAAYAGLLAEPAAHMGVVIDWRDG